MRLAHNIPQVLQRTVALRSQMPGLGVALAGGSSGSAPHTAKDAREFWRNTLVLAAQRILWAWTVGGDARKARAAQMILDSYAQSVTATGTAYTLTSKAALDPVRSGQGVMERAADIGAGEKTYSEAAESDMARARKYILEWVKTPEEMGGKRRDMRDAGKTDEEIADHISRVMGIHERQTGEYKPEMREAAQALVPHLQEFVNDVAPHVRQMSETQRGRHEEVFGELPRRFAQRTTDFAESETQMLTVDEAQSLLSAVLAEWTRTVLDNLRTGMPRLMATGMEEIKKSVNWGDPQGSLV